jgi:DNA-binding transcriptional MerR regulator
MTPSQLADLLGVASNTIRRWSKVYADFLTPSARPQTGKTRRFSRFDQRVLYFVAALRESPENVDDQQVIARLKTLQDDNWRSLPELSSGKLRQLSSCSVFRRSLPELPEEFADIDDPGVLEVVSTEQRARELATVEFLQRENVRLVDLNEQLQGDLQLAQEHEKEAQQKVAKFEEQMAALRLSERAERDDLQAQLHAAQLELKAAGGEVARLEGQLQQYGLGREKPLNVGLIIAATAISVAVLVIVLLVVVRLVL